MQPEEFLVLVAPLGLAIAGFAGLVGAFHHESAWTDQAFVRLQSLVIAAFAMTFFALWPLILLFAKVDPPEVWRLGSAFMLLYHVQILIRRGRALRRAGLRLRDLVRWYVAVLVYPLQVVHLLNVLLWASFAAYAAGIIVQLWIASAFFYGFVLDARRRPAR